MVGVVAFIVYVEGAQRRIPVQYAKRVVGRRMMGGQSTYLPLRVNSGGVIPPIFASSLLAFPATAALVLGTRWPFVKTIADALKWGEPLYTLIYISMIILFAFFYVGATGSRRSSATWTGSPGSQVRDPEARVARARAGYSPTVPSMASRSMSACPACRAVSSSRCISTQRREKCLPSGNVFTDCWSRPSACAAAWRLRSQASR